MVLSPSTHGSGRLRSVKPGPPATLAQQRALGCWLSLWVSGFSVLIGR